MAETYFDILGLSPTSDFGLIASAYQRKKVEFKDDPDRLRLVENAYQVLINPISLRKYLKDLKPIEVPKPSTGEDLTIVDPRSGVRQVADREVPSGASRKRQATEIIDLDRQVPQVSVTPAPSVRKGGRQRTELYEPDQEIKRPTSEQPVAIKAPPSSKKRQRTEIMDITEGKESVLPVIPPELSKRRRTNVEGVAAGTQKQAGRAYLVYSFSGEQLEFELQDGQNVIGRPPMSGDPPNISLPDPEHFISRQHALIIVDGTHYILRDLGSDNGTYLNDQHLQALVDYPLKDGDVIEIESRRLKVHLP